MPKTLLLADDSVTIQKVVGITFANEDVELVTVDNGDDALSRAREIRPDLVMADVSMPGLDGYELCAALKQDSELAAIPVLLLTGTFETYDAERAASVGADGYIAKPFEAQTLVEQVHTLLERPAPVAPAQIEEPAAAEAEPVPLPPPVAAPEPEPQPEPLALAPPERDPAPLAAPLLEPEPDPAPLAAPLLEPEPAPLAAPLLEPEPIPAPLAAPLLEPEPTLARPVAPEATPAMPTAAAGDLAKSPSEPPLSWAREEPQHGSPPPPPGLSFADTDPEPSRRRDATRVLDSLRPLDPEPPAAEASETRPDTPEPLAAPEELAAADEVHAHSDLAPDSLTSFFDPLAGAKPSTDADPLAEPAVAPALQAPAEQVTSLNEPLASAVSELSKPEPRIEAVDAFDPPAAELSGANAGPTGWDADEELAPELAGDPLEVGDDALEEIDDDSLELEEVDALEPEPAAAPTSAAATVADPQAIVDALEKVAWEAFGPLSEQLVREVVKKVEQIAWEIVPQMAERLIRQEIARMKGNTPEE